MTKYLRLTISGLQRVVDGVLCGGSATVEISRDGAVICREALSGKASDKFHWIYEITDTGSPVTVEAHSDCEHFKAEVDFINPFRERSI